MHCPKCQSDQTCLCSAAYAARGAAAGAATALERADLAHDAAPPCSGARAALTPLCLALGLNVVALIGTWAVQAAGQGVGLLAAWRDYEPASLRWVLLAALVAALGYLAVACRRLPADRAARARWAQLWVCRGCGAKFLPGRAG